MYRVLLSDPRLRKFSELWIVVANIMMNVANLGVLFTNWSVHQNNVYSIFSSLLNYRICINYWSGNIFRTPCMYVSKVNTSSFCFPCFCSFCLASNSVLCLLPPFLANIGHGKKISAQLCREDWVGSASQWYIMPLLYVL